MTRILGISGSLRERSYNTALLREAAELAPPDVEVRLFDLSEIPLYNDDVETVGDPEPVASLRAAVAESDALLLAQWVKSHPEPPTLKDVLQFGPYRLRKKAARDTAIALLTERHWLRQERRSAKTILVLNPQLSWED